MIMLKILRTLAVRFLYISLICLLVFLFFRFLSYHPNPRNKSLAILAWIDTIDMRVVKNFERATGIEVQITHFESNEELLVKLSVGNGQGYDLIMPSDYIVSKLVDRKLVKPIDYEKLLFTNRLIPHLTHRSFDPENTYSIPYCWTLYGIGYNTHMGGPVHAFSWHDLFPEGSVCNNPTIAMVNAAREAFAIAALMKYKKVGPLSREECAQVGEILFAQKKYVESYVDADFRANYLLGSAQVSKAVVTSANIFPILRNNASLVFGIPHEGTFLLSDNFMIPRATHKDDLIYAFLNFLYEPQIVKHHMHTFPLLIAVQEAQEYMQENGYPDAVIAQHFHPEMQLYSFDDICDEHYMYNIWLRLKTL